MASTVDGNIPQWKKELILRLKNQSKCSTDGNRQQLWPPHSASVGRAGQQPTLTCSSVVASPVNSASETCNKKPDKMVQERAWTENGDSDSSEEFQYGPGIVNKLKNRFLSLTLRETSAKVRPTILRKATSLEHLLDEEIPNGNANSRLFEPKESRNATNRYRNATRGTDMKRAHSVETISASDRDNGEMKRESFHEDMLIFKEEGNDKPHRKDDKLEITAFSNNIGHRMNRPKRIAPVVSAKEKPPVEIVKQTKKMFEGRPETRTKPPQLTGRVAATVATYKSIITQTKIIKKPPLKQKPILEKIKKMEEAPRIASPDLTSHPDVENEENRTNSSLSETPDLILHSSPPPVAISPTFRITATENFLKAEVDHAAYCNGDEPSSLSSEDHIDEGCKKMPFDFEFGSNSITYNLANSTITQRPILPTKEPSPVPQKRLNQPLEIEINGFNNVPKKISPPALQPVKTVERKIAPTAQELEKNLINSAKNKVSVKSNSSEDVNQINVPQPKRSSPRGPQEQNSIVFKFTHRKEVPDYVGNDGRVKTGKIEKPKTGEGGIILLPGASLDESATDDDEDWQSYLAGPPSPCNVTFVNDNVLIDGRSSLREKSKKSQMKIKFVEALPEIYEYPSESSLMDDTPAPPRTATTSTGHSISPLSGSSLANYIPKSATEKFQLGITHVSSPPPQPEKINDEKDPEDSIFCEAEQPMLFSAGTNSDMLF